MSRLIVLIYRFAYRLSSWGIPWVPSLVCKLFIRIPFACQIGLGAKIGRDVSLGYGGLGIVIHSRAVIGDGVAIGTGVTIGGTNKKYGVPIIGANSMIATGAKILGPVVVGQNCVVGANAVLLESIPDNCVAVGIPAKIVKRNIDITKYKDWNAIGHAAGIRAFVAAGGPAPIPLDELLEVSRVAIRLASS